MKEVEIYNINGQDYMLLDRVTKDLDTYLYFSNMSVGNDYVIRKLDRNNPEEMIPLDSEEEVKLAILLLTNKQIEDN